MSLSVQSGLCDINSNARYGLITAYLIRRFVPEGRDNVASNLWMVKVR